MPTTAVVLFDEAQADGRRRVKYRYTADSGKVFNHGPFLIGAGEDAQGNANTRISKINRQIINEEYEQVLHDLFSGLDLDARFDAGAYPSLTRNDVRRKALRRLANRMEEISPREIGELVAANDWVQSLTNATIAARLTTTTETWTNQQVNTLIKQKLTSLAASSEGIKHGKGSIEEDEN